MPTITTFEDYSAIPALQAPWTQIENYSKKGLIVDAEGKPVDPTSEGSKFVILEKRARTYDPETRAARIAEGLKAHASQRVAIPLESLPGPNFIERGNTFRLDLTAPTLPWILLEEDFIAFFTVSRDGHENLIPVVAKNIGTVDAPEYVYSICADDPQEALFQYILHAPHAEGESNLCRLLDMRPSPITDVEAFTRFLFSICPRTEGPRIALINEKNDLLRALELRKEYCPEIPVLTPNPAGATLLTTWVAGEDNRHPNGFFGLASELLHSDRTSLERHPQQLDEAIENALDFDGHTALKGLFLTAGQIQRRFPNELIYRALSETNVVIDLNASFIATPKAFVQYMLNTDPQTQLPRISAVQNDSNLEQVLTLAHKHRMQCPVRFRSRPESSLLVRWATEPTPARHRSDPDAFIHAICQVERDFLKANPHLIQKAYNLTTANWNALWRNGGAIQEFARKIHVDLALGSYESKLRAENPDAWKKRK